MSSWPADSGSQADYVRWLRAYYAAANRRSRDRWLTWSEHRYHFTATILKNVDPVGPGKRLCLLGAGNGNDVDLAQLGIAFSEIHLVDIDPTALGRAAELQPDCNGQLFLHGPVDLSGRLLARASSWAARAPDAAELDAIVDPSTEAIARLLPDRFDMVVSCCVLTEMAWALERVLGDHTELLDQSYQSLHRIHLRTMAGLLAPGGRGLLVTEMTASDTYPLEEMAAVEPLRKVMHRLTRSGNFFRSADPARLQRILAHDPMLAASVRSEGLSRPWLWQGGPRDTCLVYALGFRRVDATTRNGRDVAMESGGR